jgi:hypothetical protein
LFYRQCLERGMELSKQADRAKREGFHIESILLSHGLIQYALRGLYVLAWQRRREEQLSEEELKPFCDPDDRTASVSHLVDVLDENRFFNEGQADFLRRINAIRNKAAHGVVFGEIPMEKVAEVSEKAQWAATGALNRMQGWFSDARPIEITLDEWLEKKRRRGRTRG